MGRLGKPAVPEEQGYLLFFMLACILGLDEVASNTLKVSSYRSGRGRCGPVWSLSEPSWQPSLARDVKNAMPLSRLGLSQP